MSVPFAAVQSDCPVIDAHIHILPEEVLQSIRRWFEREVSWTIPDVSPAEIGTFIETTLNGAVVFPYAHKPGVARWMNDTVAHWQERLDHTVGLATVHAGDEEPATIVRDGLAAGLQGIKLHCPVQGFPPDDPRLDPVYELATKRELPVIIHASSHPFYRGNEILGPDPTARLLARFPSLRLCIPHLGLFETTDFLDLAERYDTLVFDTAVAVGERVHDLIDVQDGEFPSERLRKYADRIMFGSDYPTFPTSIPYAESVTATAALFPDQQEAVFHQNARQFYGLNEPV